MKSACLRHVKTYRNLYPRISAYENLFYAYLAARRRKRGKPAVASFEQVQDEELFALEDELRSKTYTPGPYTSFYIHDPKRRLISAARFRDRVVHHALCRVIEPIWEPRFIYDSYANRVGKGTHRALDRAQAFSRRYPYVLQCDIQQYFPEMDHQILKGELARRIADQDALWLCARIIDSGVGVHAQAGRPRGLPIGNLTSQFWANVYLDPLDQFVKHSLKCPAYLRYVDDLLLFAPDKDVLWDWRLAIMGKLAELRLRLHERRAQVFPVSTGIPFLGFRIYPTHRLVKRRKVVHYRRKLRHLLRLAEQDSLYLPALHASIQGWINHVRYGDTWGLRRAVLDFSLPRAEPRST